MRLFLIHRTGTYLPFGAGPRACLGKQVHALHENDSPVPLMTTDCTDPPNAGLFAHSHVGYCARDLGKCGTSRYLLPATYLRHMWRRTGILQSLAVEALAQQRGL